MNTKLFARIGGLVLVSGVALAWGAQQPIQPPAAGTPAASPQAVATAKHHEKKTRTRRHAARAGKHVASHVRQHTPPPKPAAKPQTPPAKPRPPPAAKPTTPKTPETPKKTPPNGAYSRFDALAAPGFDRMSSDRSNSDRGGIERQREQRRGALLRRVQRERQNGRRLGRELGVTEPQRELARGAARELAPVAEARRPQVRAIVERARALRQQGDVEGARSILKNELKPLLESAKPQAERVTGPIVRSLTPEQRAKLEGFAQRRGQSFDEQRLSRRLGLMLGSRRAQERLQRHDRSQQR